MNVFADAACTQRSEDNRKELKINPASIYPKVIAGSAVSFESLSKIIAY